MNREAMLDETCFTYAAVTGYEEGTAAAHPEEKIDEVGALAFPSNQDLICRRPDAAARLISTKWNSVSALGEWTSFMVLGGFRHAWTSLGGHSRFFTGYHVTCFVYRKRGRSVCPPASFRMTNHPRGVDSRARSGRRPERDEKVLIPRRNCCFVRQSASW